MTAAKAGARGFAPGAAPDLAGYDTFVIAFSGGKDSEGMLLDLIRRGVPKSRIELHHHEIDGHGPAFMDWGITRAYCRAVADALGLRIYFSCKEGGFLREMNRDGAPTAPILFEREDGTWEQVGGKGPPGTRGLFPQVTADLRVRWCSPYLKIDVLAALIRNSPRFAGKRTLVLTGERAQESASRARYATFEAHRSDLREGRRPRHVDAWRPVHAWTAERVWGIIGEHGLIPHPAYRLGWGRLSCMTCIFGSRNQWATIAALYPARFEAIAAREEQTGKTIKRGASVRALAAQGTPYPAALAQPALAALAESDEWSGPVLCDPAAWVLPAGAFGENAGPC